MAFWSGEKLKVDGARLRVVHKFDPDRIDCSAYTLTLGPEAFVTPDHSTALRDSKKLQLVEMKEERVSRRKARLRSGEVVIPAGQFAILLTEEFVKMPRSVMGFISLRFSIKGTGLINVSGFHVDPGYEGRLIFCVYNAGPTSITMTRGQELFLLWLADLDRTSAPPYVKVPDDEVLASIPEDMVSRANHKIRSLEQLSESVDAIQKQMDFLKSIGKLLATVVAIVISLMALALAGVRFVTESPGAVGNGAAPPSVAPPAASPPPATVRDKVQNATG
jgi:dCTP deaminase